MAITKRAMIAAAVLAALTSGPAGAQGKSQGKGRGPSASETAAVSASIIFRETDRATFHDYFATHKIAPQALPPGIAKNVARGKPLPPGIAKRTVPTDLLALGPKVDKDVSFSIVGEVVVAIKAGAVIDILAGVFK